MKRKRIGFLALCLSATLLFTGCAQLTEMTEDQEDLYAAYIAHMIAKYNIYQKDGAILYYPDTSDSESESEADTEQVAENTETTEASGGQTGGETGGDIDTGQVTEDVATALGVANQVTIAYQGFSVSENYMEEGESHFDMNAKTGYTYVVASFQVTASTAQTIDISAAGPVFLLNVGDKQYKQADTFLSSDLSTYSANLPQNRPASTVVIFEVPKDTAESLGETLSMSVEVGGQTILLKL